MVDCFKICFISSSLNVTHTIFFLKDILVPLFLFNARSIALFLQYILCDILHGSYHTYKKNTANNVSEFLLIRCDVNNFICTSLFCNVCVWGWALHLFLLMFQIDLTGNLVLFIGVQLVACLPVLRCGVYCLFVCLFVCRYFHQFMCSFIRTVCVWQFSFS